jgi:hypothetical protein
VPKADLHKPPEAHDDAAATAAAKQLVDGHDVELWQRDRKIGTFEQKKK